MYKVEIEVAKLHRQQLSSEGVSEKASLRQLVLYDLRFKRTWPLTRL